MPVDSVTCAPAPADLLAHALLVLLGVAGTLAGILAHRAGRAKGG